MPLIDLTKDMGLMRFVIGSHKKGNLDGISITNESEKYYEEQRVFLNMFKGM